MSDSTEHERWLPVVGYEDLYEVSALGRVRSVERWTRSRGVDRLAHRRGFLLRQLTLNSGYLAVTLSVDGAQRKAYVHHLVLEAFVGPRPDGFHGCHNDGDKSNNDARNLRWDSSSGNMRDKRKHGTDFHLNATHCPRRHPLEQPNLAPSALRNGRRACLACRRATSHVHYRRKCGEHLDLQVVSDRYYAEILLAARGA